MKTLYAVPWYNCTLNCKHCNVHNKVIFNNFDKFLSTLIAENYDNVILFGGEPLFNITKMEQIIRTGKINSISTNLILPSNISYDYISKNFVPLLSQYNISVATSWNPSRFNKEKQDLWLNAIKQLTGELDVLLLITLTRDLFVNSEIYSVLELAEKAGCTKFLFEPYIGADECNELADEWLCTFHDRYTGSMINLIEHKLDNWICDCDNTYTLEPSGEIKKGCPDSLIIGRNNFCNDCLVCSISGNCRPCPLQKTCSYPKKLAERVQNEHV